MKTNGGSGATLERPIHTATNSMKAEQSIRPVVFAPTRKYEPEEWTAEEVMGGTAIVKQATSYALSGERNGEARSDPSRIVER